MKFKVYNDNGVVRITKIAPSGIEQTMFKDLQPGKVAIIGVEAYTSYSTEVADVDTNSEGGNSNNV